jgi:DNA-binding XRE family transcriptional regulator
LINIDSNKIKSIRVAKGYTQVKIAKTLQLNNCTYSKKENGKLPFSQSEIENFVKVFNLNLQEFIQAFFPAVQNYLISSNVNTKN